MAHSKKHKFHFFATFWKFFTFFKKCKNVKNVFFACFEKCQKDEKSDPYGGKMMFYELPTYLGKFWDRFWWHVARVVKMGHRAVQNVKNRSKNGPKLKKPWFVVFCTAHTCYHVFWSFFWHHEISCFKKFSHFLNFSYMKMKNVKNCKWHVTFYMLWCPSIL